jgi:DNA polymerase III sliding clamp (beta) subunit (PCNA family)
MPAGYALKVACGMKSPSFITDGKLVAFEDSGLSVVMPVFDGRFPDYTKLIPKAESCTHQVTIDDALRKDWLDALTTIKVSKKKAVKVRFNGTIDMTSEDDTGTTTRASIPAGLKAGGEVTVLLDKRYLEDALTQPVDTIGLRGVRDPVYFRGPEACVVLMPLRADG